MKRSSPREVQFPLFLVLLTPFNVRSGQVRGLLCVISNILSVNIEGIILYMNYFNQWDWIEAFITEMLFIPV